MDGDGGAAKAVEWRPGEVDRVPYRIYVDTAIYAREQERIFAGPNWNYVALEAELPEPPPTLTAKQAAVLAALRAAGAVVAAARGGALAWGALATRVGTGHSGRARGRHTRRSRHAGRTHG